MARTDNLSNFCTDIADAIRSKTGKTGTIKASNFDTEIKNITSTSPTGTVTLTKNNTLYSVSNYQYAKTAIPTPTETINITSNGTFDVSNYGTANVNVEGSSSDSKYDDYMKKRTNNYKSLMYLFYNYTGTSVDLSDLNTLNVESCYALFQFCRDLTTITGLVISKKCTILSSCFNYCSSLTNIGKAILADVSRVSGFRYCFAKCSSLLSLPSMDMSRADDIYNMLDGCSSLTTLEGFLNLGYGYSTSQSTNYSSYTLDLSNSTQLTKQSLLNVINNLYDIKTKGCNAQKLVLGSTNIAKLSSSEISVATSKGWTVS